jgi:hypothetical protein
MKLWTPFVIVWRLLLCIPMQLAWAVFLIIVLFGWGPGTVRMVLDGRVGLAWWMLRC